MNSPPSGGGRGGAEHVQVSLEAEEVERSHEDGGRSSGARGRASVHIGPVPSPDVLKGYHDLNPQYAERLFSMAEREAAHRHRMDERAMDSHDRLASLGVWSGLTVGIVGLLVALGVAFIGHPTAAAIIGGIDLATLVAVFVTGRRRDPATPAARKDPESPATTTASSKQIATSDRPRELPVPSRGMSMDNDIPEDEARALANPEWAADEKKLKE